MNKWIPCSERMPEEDGTYLVSGIWENGDVEVGQLQYIADEHRFSNVIYFNVDAWMPLPKPYRNVDYQVSNGVEWKWVSICKIE